MSVKQPRDINRIMSFLLKRVIPETETKTRERLMAFYRGVFFRAPEVQGVNPWRELAELLEQQVGVPDCEWKVRVQNIVCDYEKLPEDFHELLSA